MPTTPAEQAAAVIRSLGVEQPLHLVTLDAARRHVSERCGVTPATASRRVRAAVEGGLLVQFRPHSDWSMAYALPGNAAYVRTMDVYAHREEQFLTSAEPPGGRPPVVGTLFVAHHDQLNSLGRFWAAEAAARTTRPDQGEPKMSDTTTQQTPDEAQEVPGVPETKAAYEVHYQEHRRPEWWTTPEEFEGLAAAEEYAEKLETGRERPRGNPRASVARVRIVQNLTITTVIRQGK
ncbi:hypothetical protein [Streptomyces albidoflavus]|uniref:hypothetical protein n=1 Tax=Streptomyces albidoflavus TaxID=1886 RepID=UPI0034048446